MENVHEIVNKIITDAISYCVDTLKNANDIVREKIAKAEDTVAKNLENEKIAIKNVTCAQIETKTAIAKKDIENIVLDKKQVIIDETFALAYKKLCGLDRANYLKIVEKSIISKAQANDKIMLSCDGVLMPADLFSLAIVRDLNLQTVKTSGDFVGGVKLIRGDIVIDLTFLALIDDMKNSLSNKLQLELFGE